MATVHNVRGQDNDTKQIREVGQVDNKYISSKYSKSENYQFFFGIM